MLILCAALVVFALVMMLVSVVTRATHNGREMAREVAAEPRGDAMRKIGFAALIIVMLGVTSGLLGGL
ncbi:hypothetical protein D6850_04775 [Roseovarius spongiae]|uniref:Uncharacterized protein n=1 Tax=Roseovarius spongiae TaxID=2320272 RepID=A0A3A8BBL2_9RHOB|nr:hypothetical protein D6850_04775 [Roseovarius spongiae]